MAKPIRKEAYFDHPIETVWAALTTKEAIAEWLMPNDFEPVVGRKFVLQVDPAFKFSGINECEVLEVDAPHRLVYSWVVVPRDPDALRLKPMTLTWQLEREGHGTRLRFEQTGAEVLPWFYRFSMRMGWGRYIKKLMPMTMRNFKDGHFAPGAVPRRMRCYGIKTIPDHLAK